MRWRVTVPQATSRPAARARRPAQCGSAALAQKKATLLMKVPVPRGLGRAPKARLLTAKRGCTVRPPAACCRGERATSLGPETALQRWVSRTSCLRRGCGGAAKVAGPVQVAEPGVPLAPFLVLVLRAILSRVTFIVDTVMVQFVLPFFTPLFDSKLSGRTYLRTTGHYLNVSVFVMGEQKLLLPGAKRRGEGNRSLSPPTVPGEKVIYLVSHNENGEAASCSAKMVLICAFASAATQTNHRSWGDFFIDLFLVEFQGAYLSRWAVFAVLPIACAVSWLGRQGLVIFFARKKSNVDKNALLKLLDRHFEVSMNGGLIVYPEGTRNQRPYSNPVKFGLIKYAYTRRIPCQVMISEGKERVWNEKIFATRLDKRVTVMYGKPMYPEEYVTSLVGPAVHSTYATLEEFVEKFKESWYNAWATVYGFPTSEALEAAKPFLSLPSDMDLSPESAAKRRRQARRYKLQGVAPLHKHSPSAGSVVWRLATLMLP
eukprot:scaffold200_cov401-Prasinococcus_capsulatus_cf.AAC.9